MLRLARNFNCISKGVGMNVRSEAISHLVDQIEREPFNAKIGNKYFAREARGWSARLAGYFWPTPDKDFYHSQIVDAKFTNWGRNLVSADRPWCPLTRKSAEKFASDIFLWGGVRQNKYSADHVYRVMLAALSGGRREIALKDAPMNSGWSKVAAFLTAHLEEQDGSLVIWDSRVSCSLVGRLDRMCGDQEINNIFPGIGRVPDRGGNRWSMELKCRWPNAYRRWDSQFAASKLTREIRNELRKRSYVFMDRSGACVPWSVRNVEKVLFMDGYRFNSN